MSKGLGTLQREILLTLDEARDSRCRYRGTDSSPGTTDRWVKVHRAIVRMDLNTYDLRASSRFLWGRRPSSSLSPFSVDGSRAYAAFQAAFSRAVRGLVRAGYLHKLIALPFDEIDEDPLKVADGGTHVRLSYNQVRFVWREDKRYDAQPNAYHDVRKEKRVAA